MTMTIDDTCMALLEELECSIAIIDVSPGDDTDKRGKIRALEIVAELKDAYWEQPAAAPLLSKLCQTQGDC